MSAEFPLPQLPTMPNAHISMKSQEPRILDSSDVLEIHKALVAARQGIQTLDEQIAHFETEALVRKQAREQHEEFVEQQRRLLSSHRRLPIEIWTEIFKIASLAPPPESDNVFRSATVQTCPLSISHVCAEWRRLALRTPVLWTIIALHVGHSFPASKLKLIVAYLSRGRSHPLFLRVTTDVSPRAQADAGIRRNFETAMKLLTTHAARWEDVDLQLYSDVYKSDVFPVHRTTSLKSLRITTVDCLSERGLLNPTVLTHALGLLRFTIGNFLASKEGFKLMIPWTSLTTCHIEYFATNAWGYSIDETLYILRTCTSLQELKVFYDHSEPKDSTPCHHSSLNSLRIQSYSTVLFRLLTAPKLRDFAVKQMKVEDLRDFASFIDRCPSLNSISLDNFEGLSVLDKLSSPCPITELLIRICYKSKIASSTQALLRLSESESFLTNFPQLRSVQFLIDFVESNRDFPDPVIVNSLADAVKALGERLLPRLDEFTVKVKRSSVPEMTLEAFKVMKEMYNYEMKVVLY